MKIIAIDIGTGTQDILLYDTKKEVENSLVMVMPSPTVIIADRIRRATDAGMDIVLTGGIMGGGPCVRAIKEHIDKGLLVYATRNAALTINDNLDRVCSMGVTLIGEQEIISLPDDVLQVLLQDIDTDAIFGALLNFGVTMGSGEPVRFAIALQDHGESPDMSNRICRFRYFEEQIKKGGDLDLFTYSGDDIPLYLTRIKSASRTLGESGFDTNNRGMDRGEGKDKDENMDQENDTYHSIFMDTGPAAVFGALLDTAAEQPSIVVNIGNGHTLGALVIDNRVRALFEHHTSKMDVKKLQDYIIRLAEGTLTFEDVFNDGGHGCYIGDAVGFDAVRSVMVTGPKRGVLQNSMESQRNTELWAKLSFAAPFGNMMLSGCFGLLSAFLENEKGFTNKAYKLIGN
ncbi:MAG TPA: pyruvate formate lyase-activating protein [Methanosarcinaceae archaeon]|nr:pyruvate formate lyase-activating protein [Methanosarcinaceae archaeon]